MRTRIVALAAFLLCLAVTSMAQTDTGIIRGVIQDPSGATIPQASVIATNNATGVRTTVASTSSGLYEIPFLRPGLYTVEVEKEGFKKLVRPDVHVIVSIVTSLDARLEVGTTTQSVTVTGASPLLQAETTEMNTSIESRPYLDLPIAVGGAGRHPMQFVFLAPGVQGDTFATKFNGSQILSTDLQLDGLSLRAVPVTGDTRPLGMSPEAIQEFTVATGDYSAEYGDTGGGITRFTIRSGTNGFHGEVHDFNQNDIWNARPFFSPKKSKINQNEFGFSVGGPVIRDKAFFFYNFKRFWRRTGGNQALTSVPTQAMKQGDFSGLIDNTGKQIPIYDPFSTVLDANGNPTRTQFPGNVIPPSRFSAVAKNVLPLLPDPNRPGIVNNFFGVFANPFDQRAHVFRTDIHIRSTHSLSVSGYYGKQESIFNAGPLPSPLQNQGRQPGTRDGARLSYNWIINPSTVLNLSAGINRELDSVTSLDWGQNWSAKLGIKNVPPNCEFEAGSTLSPPLAGPVCGGQQKAFPLFHLSTSSSTSSPGIGDFGFGTGGFFHVADTYLYAASISKTTGRHHIKTGAELRKFATQFRSPGDTQFSFSPSGTGFPSPAFSGGQTGFSFASFLLGWVDSGGIGASPFAYAGRWTYQADYIQDDIKLTPNLTLNAGLRWELYMPITDEHDYYSIIDPSIPNPGCIPNPGQKVGCYGAIVYAGFGPGRAGRRRLTNGISMNNFGPRIGLAWRVTPKWVVRSAYGINYSAGSTALGGGNVRNQTNGGFSLGAGFGSPNLGIIPGFLLDNGFPALSQTGKQPTGPLESLDPSTWIGQGGWQLPSIGDPTTGVNTGGGDIWHPNATKPPYIQSWNFTLQYSPKASWSISTAYVGQKGTRLLAGLWNPNQLHPKYLSLGSLLFKDISDPAVVAAGFTKPYANFSGTLAQSLKPFPQYLGVGDVGGSAGSATIGNSTYHALQVKVEHQFAAGLFLLSSYTWSKTLDDAASGFGGFFSTNARDTYSTRIEKALDVNDIPSRWTTGFIYELPIGPGKPLLNKGGPAGKVFGGWELTSTLLYQSGTPLQIGVNNITPLGSYRNLPNVVPGVPMKASFNKFDPARDVYLNINAFSDPGAFAIGNGPSVFPVRDFPTYNENIGLIKRTTIHERFAVEVRLEFFDVLNRHRFSDPNTNVSDPIGFGKVSGASGNRSGQAAIRVTF
jgi:hypothetical protein